MTGIVGILLAAGRGQRFGSDKRLQALADGTVMALAAGRKLAAVCQRTIVVVRPDDMAMTRLLSEAGLESVVCANAAQGMGHSLAAGVAASEDAAGWLVALADMPYIQATSYGAVLHAMQSGAGLARAFYGGRPGHPVGFAAEHRQALLALTGDQGGKAILEAHPAMLVPCQVDDPGVLHDIDRPGQIWLPRGADQATEAAGRGVLGYDSSIAQEHENEPKPLDRRRS
jgi:molybdenum cofactor cytidylyltransferase